MTLGSRRTIVPWRPARQADRRLGWGIGDQAVSSLTNFAVNIYIAGLFMTSPSRPAPMTAAETTFAPEERAGIGR